jgi:S1-C subfamily serine protease
LSLRRAVARHRPGVGFAIPSNVVRRVAPALIEQGEYRWPWLGVKGTGVGLIIMEASNLDTQRGAYIDVVRPDSPASEAGMQGSTGFREVDGASAPVGGDVVVEANGAPVSDFDDLLVEVAFMRPGDEMSLVVLRDGQRQTLMVTLAARPGSFGR